MRMEGREVFKHAVAKLGGVIEEALDANGLTAAGVELASAAPGQPADHRRDGQAQKPPPERSRVLHRAARQHFHGLCPLALTEAVGDGRIKSAIWYCSKRSAEGFAQAPGSSEWVTARGVTEPSENRCKTLLLTNN